jgi:hypothetical protein
VVACSKPNKVLIDGGSGLNVLFTKTLKKMKLDITHMLTKSTSPFYGIVPGNAAIPLGSVVLPVTFVETRDNYRTEYIKGPPDRQVIITTNEMPGPSGTVHDRYLEDISADELSANAPAEKPMPTGTLDVNATESETNGADVSASPFPSGTLRKHSTKSRARCTLPQSNASCLSLQ